MDETFTQMMAAHLALYPGMEVRDAIKLLYQAEMGGGHLIEDVEGFEGWLQRELAGPGLFEDAAPGVQPMGPRLCRVHLKTLYSGPAVETVARLCALSAKRCADEDAAGGTGGTKRLQSRLQDLQSLAQQGRTPWSADDVKQQVREYLAAGCPAVHHSERYRALYSPHYRVMHRDMALYLPVFAAIDKALAQKPHILVGIDGMSGAGKSRLAALLQQVYGCGLVHADDFFLQPAQRQQARLAEVGGNIDYERLAPVAAQAGQAKAFEYQAYDCQTGGMGQWRKVPESALAVLEGVYALHPKVAAPCDVRVFLQLDAGVQQSRILARSGEVLAKRFREEWIPMENAYFAGCGVRQQADVILDTGEIA